MICQRVQQDLSLYLYGELDFAAEEHVEEHLESCAFCQQALTREKSWHANLHAEQQDVPLDFLAQCRRELHLELSKEAAGAEVAVKSVPRPFWANWLRPLRVSATDWSTRLAAASLLLMAGFGAGRWVSANGLPGSHSNPISEMGLLSPQSRVRDVRQSEDGHIRIVVEQVNQREVTGRLDDQWVRDLILSATREPADPALRVDSVQILSGQPGTDVRDALIASVHHDPNAAVRLKAVEGLRRFAYDSATRDALKHVLEHDDNAGVRSEAIDVLALSGNGMTPEVQNILMELLKTGPNSDDYVRTRALQLLQQADPKTGIY